MFFEKPLLGKVYEDDCFLTSGMLYENNGRILLELHNEGANPESDYFGQLAPGSAVKQADGSVALSSARMKSSPKIMSFYAGPKEQSCLLLDCRLVSTDFTLGGGPYNFRRVVEVGRLVQMSDTTLRSFGSKYSEINRMRATIPALNSWLGKSLMFCWIPFDNKNSTNASIAYGLRKEHSIRLGWVGDNQQFAANLKVVGSTTSKANGTRASLYSDTIFSTYSQKRLNIDEHIRVHLQLLGLLEIAYGHKLSVESIEVTRNDDKPYPKKMTVFRNLLTPEIAVASPKDVQNTHRRDPVFNFSDIREDGIKLWFELIGKCPTGIQACVRLFENEKYLPLESQFLLVGVAIEHLGYTLMGKDDHFRPQIRAILNCLSPLLVREHVDEWVDGVAKSYNGIKHFHQASKKPESLEMVEYLMEAKLLLRLLIAQLVGCDITVLEQYVHVHPLLITNTQPLFREHVGS